MTRVHPSVLDLPLTFQVGGRLSLVSGDAVPESPVVGATTVYLVPVGNNVSVVYDGTLWQVVTFNQLSLTLHSTHLIDTNYDAWDFLNSGTLAIGLGPAWATGGGTAYERGTGTGSTELEVFQGRLVNKYVITVRNGASTYTVPARQASLRGTVRMTANGTTEDSLLKRFVSNLHNPELRPMVRAEPTSSWTYSTAAWRLANNNSLNRIQYVQCVTGRRTVADVQSVVYNSTSTFQQAGVGLGINSYVNAATRTMGVVVANRFLPTAAYYEGYPGLGHRVFNWMEYGAGAETQTWVGNFSGGELYKTGMSGETWL